MIFDTEYAHNLPWFKGEGERVRQADQVLTQIPASSPPWAVTNCSWKHLRICVAENDLKAGVIHRVIRLIVDDHTPCRVVARAL